MNIYENKRYKIRCNKCGILFEYGIEDRCASFVASKDDIIMNRGNVVYCPNCLKEYTYGYESARTIRGVE